MSCPHLDDLNPDTLISKAQFPVFHCEECLRIHSHWVHLRICQSCGKMLCCDSSINQHARRHFEDTGHPIISSAELGEQWVWCFAHEQGKPY